MNRKVIGIRPKTIPPHWAIYNAPRPLYGDKHWKGHFYHGIFYAAVDPAGDDAQTWDRRNKELDAWRLEFVSEEQVIEQSLVYYRDNLPKVADKIDPTNPKHREQLIDSWIARQREAR